MTAKYCAAGNAEIGYIILSAGRNGSDIMKSVLRACLIGGC